MIWNIFKKNKKKTEENVETTPAEQIPVEEPPNETETASEPEEEIAKIETENSNQNEIASENLSQPEEPVEKKKGFFNRIAESFGKSKNVPETPESKIDVEIEVKIEEEPVIYIKPEIQEDNDIPTADVTEVEEEAPVVEPVEKKKGFFSRIAESLGKTRKNIQNSFDNILKNFKKLDDEVFDELTEALIMADIGASAADKIIDSLRKSSKENKINTAEEVKELLAGEISKILSENSTPLEIKTPMIILVVGVNGVGKTTSIGKLAARFRNEGKKVMLAAGDTFRAAAIDQLEIWAERAGVPLIKHQENSDPGAVVFDAVKAAQARNTDILICDTAGRLQNKKNLMDELKKISRIIEREFPNSHKEVFLVLDATTGQNALSQASVFKEITNVTGVILTKLDGTAKGGIVVPIKRDLGLDVRFVCVGEGIEDIEPFEPLQFSKALFMDEE